MLRLDFDLEDLAALRFAVSPAAETVGALRLVGDPERSRVHGSWLASVTDVALDAPLRLALELLPPRGYVPDFLTPPVLAPVGDLAAELAAIRVTPPEVVRDELNLLFADREPPACVQALYDDPEQHLAQITAALARWHARVLAPHWERIYAVLAADIAHRARQLAEGGPELALRRLHPTIRWQGGRLTVDLRFDARFRLDGRGLLLVPSAFWRGVGPIVLGSWQPTLLYPARGIELLWHSERPAPQALTGVLGAARAWLLDELDHPASTTHLAQRLGMTAPGVSQHLQRLRRAGLVTANRAGREVRYQRTPLGEQLLQAATANR
jgi:DNA-binding transcriptional ArsR family regulator